mmetsp:Transcript_18709/g.30013  ORF Transcript_18709/g.30013 Transcript_18709/m.30013 type:complete len:366 (-) Transcript_18709:50-1147(-)
MACAAEKVILDVGGTLFTTSMATLRSSHAADSWFGPRFSGQFGDSLQAGSIFIDRDPAHFGKVLNFLRDGFCVLPDNLGDLRELWHEADFYSMAELKRLIEKSEPMQAFFSCTDAPGVGAVSEREHERDIELQEQREHFHLLEEAWKHRADRICTDRMQSQGRRSRPGGKRPHQNAQKEKLGMKLQLAVEAFKAPRLAQLITEVLLDIDECELLALVESKQQLSDKIEELSIECLHDFQEFKSNKGKGKGGKKGGKGKGGKKGVGKDSMPPISGSILRDGHYDHPGRLVPTQGPRSHARKTVRLAPFMRGATTVVQDLLESDFRSEGLLRFEDMMSFADLIEPDNTLSPMDYDIEHFHPPFSSPL